MAFHKGKTNVNCEMTWNK